ncbi:MAG: hypothetical protein AAF378_20040 [Cyanobacteria bacterium P01_A01_bin.84]
MSKVKDETGNRYGRLVVLNRVNSTTGRAKWNCRCDCGNTKIASGKHLRRGAIQSCGCLQKDSRTKHCHTSFHGVASRTYNAWHNMKQRCNNPKYRDYHNYGGKGITYDLAWENFANFLADMGKCPNNLELDRIDSNKNYCKSNCRWADEETQANNRLNNRYVTLNGKTQTIAQWCRELNLNYSSVMGRLKLGWDEAKALTTPIASRKK